MNAEDETQVTPQPAAAKSLDALLALAGQTQGSNLEKPLSIVHSSRAEAAADATRQPLKFRIY